VECAVIGEVKTPNKFQYADEQIKGYLSRDLEEATIGFATDGVRWKVYARPERKADHDCLTAVDFTDAFRMMPSRHLQEESYSAHSVRKTLTSAEELTRSAIETKACQILSD
jgi:hypothetical protein